MHAVTVTLAAGVSAKRGAWTPVNIIHSRTGDSAKSLILVLGSESGAGSWRQDQHQSQPQV